MSAEFRSVTGRAYHFELVPIAQSTEQARPKRQVAGESPAGDTSFCGCGSTAECGRAKAETTVRLRSPAPIFGAASHAGDYRSEAGQGRQFHALKALSAMRSLGKRISSVQFRVGAPVFGRVVKREQQTPQIENL